jgi:hypothetical protein
MTTPKPPELPILKEVGAELSRIFHGPAAVDPLPHRARRRRVGRRPNLRVLVLVAVLVLGATAGAVAASGILSGAPVPAFHFTPTEDAGVPKPASVRLLKISTPDPAGGPRWGLRAMTTTRGLGCLQYGRLVDGRLGVLGQDGAFHNDGRFHALPPGVFQFWGCTPLDGNGRSYFAAYVDGIPASGYQACTPAGARRTPTQPPSCPAADERALYYGALGAQATSITYTIGGHTHTTPTTGPDGAYLIVTQATPGANPDITGPGAPNGSGLLPHGTSQPIRRINYSNGTVCFIGAHGDRDNHGKRCTPPGYVSAPRLPTAAQVRSGVSVRVRLNGRLPGLGRLPFAEITFTARVRITGAGNSYAYHYQAPSSGPCRGDSGGGATDTNLAAGQRVTFRVQITGGPRGRTLCPGTYTGRIAYVSQTTAGRRMSGPTVAHFTIHVP